MSEKIPRRRTKLALREYALLAAFRYALRSFLHFSESATEGSGLTAQHYQAMLVVRGCPEDRRVAINDLAQQLLIGHNSAVGLVDRLQKQGLVAREASPLDRRKVYLRLTARGDRLLDGLAEVHREELTRIGPAAQATPAADHAGDGLRLRYLGRFRFVSNRRNSIARWRRGPTRP